MKMTTLKGVFPEPTQRRKNFIHENVKNLRKMEQCFHLNKEVDEMQKSQSNKHNKVMDKYVNITPKVNTSFRAKKQENNIDKTVSNHEPEKQPLRKISTPTMNKKNIKSSTKKPLRPAVARPLNKQKKEENVKASQPDLQINVSSDPNLAHKHVEEEEISSASKFKHQSIQTLDEKHIDKLYMEGVIRYPSKKGLRNDEQVNSDRLDFNQETKENNPVSPSDHGDTCLVDKLQSDELKGSQSSSDMVNFVKLNKERASVATKLATQLNNGVPPPNYRKGVVPKYIRDRKEAQQKEEKNKAATFDPDCPEGHVPLPDHERKETLRMLKKNYQDYVNELNMMPIKADTLRVQKRKIEIEKQLNKLEEGIKVFSRPKVYVKVNA